MDRINYCLKCGERLHGYNCEGFCQGCFDEAGVENEDEDED